MVRRRLQKRLTEQGIERLNYDAAAAPPSGRMEIEDEVCPGLLLRVTPRGVKSFSVIYKVPGEAAPTPTGGLLSAASIALPWDRRHHLSSRRRENRPEKLSRLRPRVEILVMIAANEI